MRPSSHLKTYYQILTTEIAENILRENTEVLSVYSVVFCFILLSI